MWIEMDAQNYEEFRVIIVRLSVFDDVMYFYKLFFQYLSLTEHLDGDNLNIAQHNDRKHVIIPVAFVKSKQNIYYFIWWIIHHSLSTRIYQDLSSLRQNSWKTEKLLYRVASLFQKLCISNNLQK